MLEEHERARDRTRTDDKRTEAATLRRSTNGHSWRNRFHLQYICPGECGATMALASHSRRCENGDRVDKVKGGRERGDADIDDERQSPI